MEELKELENSSFTQTVLGIPDSKMQDALQ